MSQTFRTVVLATSVIALGVYVAMVSPVRGVFQTVEDQFDERPETRILFIGNSRTFYNDMPQMVRWMADSAKHPERLEIKVHAWSGATLEEHWADPEVQSLIAEGWDHVIVQAQSTEQYSAELSGTVWQTATRFIDAARAIGAQPAMFVTWRYADRCDDRESLPPVARAFPVSGYANMHLNIQFQHAQLAAATGVDLVNVGAVWEPLQGQSLAFPLYSDCNHPSVQGSYLSALMMYNYLTGLPIEAVTYEPILIEPKDADFLRRQVEAYLRAKAPS